MANYLLNNKSIIYLILLTITNIHANTLEISGKYSHINITTKNWQELKQQKLVRQQWDISCGAAALSTLMTWYHDLALDEKTVANALLRTTKVDRVRARGGFSLLDLKRFVEAIGFSAEGYGQMTINDLNAMNKPAILPINLYGLDHFVVYRGQVGDRFYIGDPAFGNMSLKKSQFYDIWKSRIGFFVSSEQTMDFKNHGFHANKNETNINDLKKINWSDYASFIPTTRRSQAVLP